MDLFTTKEENQNNFVFQHYKVKKSNNSLIYNILIMNIRKEFPFGMIKR